MLVRVSGRLQSGGSRRWWSEGHQLVSLEGWKGLNPSANLALSSTMISKLQAVVQSDCQFGYVFAEPQGARPWFRLGKGFSSKNKPLTMLSSSLSRRSQKHSPPVYYYDSPPSLPYSSTVQLQPSRSCQSFLNFRTA